MFYIAPSRDLFGGIVMSYILSIQKALDYIEEHLHEDIILEEVAASASYSYYHFQRIFKAVLGCSLKHYIKSRRLTCAAYEIIQTNKRILEIALKYRFESHEAFTRAFKQQFSILPAHYRKRRPYINLVGPQHISELFPKDANKDVLTTITPIKVSRGAFYVVGIEQRALELAGSPNRSQTTELNIPNLWKNFNTRLDEIEGRVDPFVSYGIGKPTGGGVQFSYMAGVEVESPNIKVPKGMICFQVPGGSYAAFSHNGPASKISKLTNYIYSSWIPNSPFQLNFGVEIEVYDQRETKVEANEVSLDIWVPIKE